MAYRELLPQEEKLLGLLISRASSLSIPDNWKTDLMVESMNDGGMGSLRLLPSNVNKENRLFGKQISEYKFLDSDDIEVIASLYLDQNNELFEIDVWKVDFSSVKQFG